MTEPSETHLLGAWGVGPTPPGHPATLLFSSFLPAVVHKQGLMANMAIVMAARTSALANLYLQGKAPASPSLKASEQMIHAAEEPGGLAAMRRALLKGVNALKAEAALKASEQRALAGLGPPAPSVDRALLVLQGAAPGHGGDAGQEDQVPRVRHQASAAEVNR